MIRNIVRQPYYNTDRFPPCIFEKNINLFYKKRDEYLQSGAAIYDKDMLLELRRRAGNAESAENCRRKKKIHRDELRLHAMLLKRRTDLLEEERELVLSQLQITRYEIEDVRCEIEKELERNPSKALGQLSEIKALGINVEWLESESFGGLDGDSAQRLLEDI